MEDMIVDITTGLEVTRMDMVTHMITDTDMEDAVTVIAIHTVMRAAVNTAMEILINQIYQKNLLHTEILINQQLN